MSLETNSDFFEKCFDQHDFNELNDLDAHLIRFAIKLFMTTNKKTNPVLFDVGTNAGSFVKVVQEFGLHNVHCFEPHPHLSNTVMEKYPYVKMNKSCLTDTIGTIPINFPKWSVGLSSVVNRPVFDVLKNKGQDIIRVDVPTTTIDEYCRITDVDEIDFVKIDVEGAEKMVLDGASNMLKTNKIKMGFFEVGETLKDAGTSEGEICDMLRGYGYIINTKIPMNYLFYLK